MDLTNVGCRVDGNHSALLNILCKQRCGLNVVHFNARSLNGSKLDDVRIIFENSKVDVVCVTETWFNAEVTDSHYKINGYNLFRNCRKGRKGGGVAVYCRTNINAKVVNMSNDSDVEFINVVIFDNAVKVLLSCVYNPSRMFTLEPFFTDFKNHIIDYDFFITCGDFNVNLMVKDTISDELLDHFSSVGMTVVNDIIPTRFSSNSRPSLLDLFVLSDPNLLLLYDQISFVSDHDLLFCTFNINLCRNNNTRLITYRDYNSIDFPSLFSEVSDLTWNDCWYQPSVDGKLDVFLTTLRGVYDRHVPERSFYVKNSSCPWYTSAVKESIRNRNLCYNIWKKKPTLLNRAAYNRARNHSNLVVRQAKKSYFCQKLNISLPTSQLWKNIKNLGVHSRSSPECCLDPDELNDSFCNSDAINTNNINLPNEFFCNSSFTFSVVSEADVFKHVCKIRSNAIGEDGVAIKFVKLILPYVVGSLAHIFNHCITTSTFPRLWKLGRIIPVAKISTAVSPNDYRPISILPVFSKVFESLIADQITTYLDYNRLLSPLQSGFRSAHSCTTAALKVMDDIRPEYDLGNLSLMCLLDFSKAFDKVDHSILCQKLKHYFGFTETALTLMKNYLSGRAQKVVVGDKQSMLRGITSGVPQGSVLGPLLFSIFINDIFSVCNYARVHAYADDIQLYLSNRVGLTEDLCYKLNEDLTSISNWAKLNNLILNPKKSYVLPISKFKLDPGNFPTLYLNDTPLIYVNKVKYLGFFINSTFSCTDHINNVVRNVYLVLRNLRMSSNCTPTEVKRKLVIQLIIPLISYSAEVYSKLDSHSLHKLQVSFNNATRYVYGLTRFSSISCWRRMVLGYDLVDYLRMRNLIFLHKLLYQKTPLYLYEKLVFGRSTRCTTLIVPRHNYLNTSRLFFVNAIKLWNSLPINIKLISRKNSFKNSLIEYITINILTN